MKATLSISKSDASITESVATEVDLIEEIKDGRRIFGSADLGFRFSVRDSNDIRSINVLISEENKTVIVNYTGEKDAVRCCVTCNGWQFCGDSACCELLPAGSGNWLCC